MGNKRHVIFEWVIGGKGKRGTEIRGLVVATELDLSYSVRAGKKRVRREEVTMFFLYCSVYSP